MQTDKRQASLVGQHYYAGTFAAAINLLPSCAFSVDGFELLMMSFTSASLTEAIALSIIARGLRRSLPVFMWAAPIRGVLASAFFIWL
jgi:hypothetical protein